MPEPFEHEEVGKLLKDASAMVAELDAATDPVVRVHEDTKATVEQLGCELSWDESPAGRGGIRT